MIGKTMVKRNYDIKPILKQILQKRQLQKMSTAARSTFSNARITNVNQLLNFFQDMTYFVNV
jgi:hypothetical protein